MSEGRGGSEFKARSAGASQIFANAQNGIGDGCGTKSNGSRKSGTGDVGDRVDDLVVEKRAAKFEMVFEGVHRNAGIATGKMFSGQESVGVGEGVALAEGAVEFIERRRAEGAVNGSVPGNIGIDLVTESGARAEGVLRAVGEFGVGRDAGGERNADGGRVEIAPVIDAGTEGKQPARRDLN